MPTAKKDIDPRSLIIGFLSAIVILLLIALANAKKEKEPIADAAPEAQTPPSGYIGLFQQEQMAAQTIQEQIQSMLDGLIGEGRSIVRVRTLLNPDNTLERQHVALSIDNTPKSNVVQGGAGRFIQPNRPQ